MTEWDAQALAVDIRTAVALPVFVQGVPAGVFFLLLDGRLKDEFERARRYRLRFSLTLIDVDHLRDLNEKFGDGVGDQVLADLGPLLQRELRAPDFVARYGGDEFALVLPETDARGARNFVHRFRGLIAKHAFADLAGTVPAVSAGIVSYPHPDVLRAADLFPLAEAALAAAKATAPDHIAVAPTSGRYRSAPPAAAWPAADR